VTVPTAAGRPGPRGIRIHRCATLRPDETRRRRRISVTSPVRTLLDLAPLVTARRLRRMVDEAHVQRLCTPAQLAQGVAVRGGRPGTPALAALLAQHEIGSTVTFSELEERFLALCVAAGLPRPDVNAPGVAGRVDFTWPALRLAVETDGGRFHSTRAAIERDRAKEARLVTSGWRVLRFTWRQVVFDQDLVVAALVACLSG
jgi:hypothetical protein